MGEIEKLRQAREAMNEIFPLTPTMWQEWARDEASISTGYFSFLFCSYFLFCEQIFVFLEIYMVMLVIC